MKLKLKYRKASIDDLRPIIDLLIEDILGKIRENQTLDLDPQYIDAFYRIDVDPNQSDGCRGI